MSVDVATRIAIERPRDAVSAFTANPDNAPLWYVNIKSVEWMSAAPLRIGTRIAFVAYLETTYEWRSLSATRTEMTLPPFLAMAMRRANGKDLLPLKARLKRDA